MLVDNLDSQVCDRFQREMKKHDTDVIPLLKNSTKFAQPVDRHFGVRIKKLVKKNFRALLEEQCEKLEKRGSVKKISVSQLRILISKWVSDAWKEVCAEKEFMVNTFRKTGLSLAIDGSQDGEMSFPDVGQISVVP